MWCEAQLHTVDGPGQTSVSTSLQTLELVDLCWACLVSNDRLLLINGLEPILQCWVQHKPHALNMTMPLSAARARKTERWRERERHRERRHQITTYMWDFRWLKNLKSTKLPAIQHLLWCAGELLSGKSKPCSFFAYVWWLRVGALYKAWIEIKLSSLNHHYQRWVHREIFVFGFWLFSLCLSTAVGHSLVILPLHLQLLYLK